MQRSTPISWTAIGLMSGTSTDGISAALVRLRPTATGYQHRLLAFRTTAYSVAFRSRLLRVAEGGALPASELSALNVALGARLAQAAAAVARDAGIAIGRVDAIGSHGHTLFHGPPGSGRSRPPSTMQIGEPAVIAARTGVTTVADFRPADIAVGGQGAPLVPYVHWLLFAAAREGRVIQNVGGIANLTYLPPGGSADRVIAFDTGPGNMVIDAVAMRLFGSHVRFDRGGMHAARGRIDQAFVREALRHPYFARRPPKSTGREEFGAAFVDHLLARARRARWQAADTLATATALTAASIADALRRFVRPHGRIDAIYAAGGGARNDTLLQLLQRMLPDLHVATLDELGVPPMTIEAVSFAVLACEALRGRTANVPAVTGASRRTVLGKIVPGTPPQWRRLRRRIASA